MSEVWHWGRLWQSWPQWLQWQKWLQQRDNGVNDQNDFLPKGNGCGNHTASQHLSRLLNEHCVGSLDRISKFLGSSSTRIASPPIPGHKVLHCQSGLCGSACVRRQTLGLWTTPLCAQKTLHLGFIWRNLHFTDQTMRLQVMYNKARHLTYSGLWRGVQSLLATKLSLSARTNVSNPETRTTSISS